jgi:hypothetical protein
MLGIFLLALSASETPTRIKEVAGTGNDVPPAPAMESHTVVAAEVSVEGGIDSEIPGPGNANPNETRQLAVRDSGLGLDPQSWNQSMGDYEQALNQDDTEVSRYLVWSPFRSEWAAEGFARRLALAADVPLEVRNEGPENYQVIFRYRDDGERQAMVRQIETITGLELE